MILNILFMIELCLYIRLSTDSLSLEKTTYFQSRIWKLIEIIFL